MAYLLDLRFDWNCTPKNWSLRLTRSCMSCSPLLNIDTLKFKILMENHHVYYELIIFHSYVKLPEGNVSPWYPNHIPLTTNFHGYITMFDSSYGGFNKLGTPKTLDRLFRKGNPSINGWELGVPLWLRKPHMLETKATASRFSSDERWQTHMDLDGERDQSKWRLAPTEQSVGHMGSMCLAYKMVYVDILYIYIIYYIYI